MRTKKIIVSLTQKEFKALKLKAKKRDSSMSEVVRTGITLIK